MLDSSGQLEIIQSPVDISSKLYPPIDSDWRDSNPSSKKYCTFLILYVPILIDRSSGMSTIDSNNRNNTYLIVLRLINNKMNNHPL